MTDKTTTTDSSLDGGASALTAELAAVVEAACFLSRHNKTALKATKGCGCYFCLRSFHSSDVFEFVDSNADTALCPRCGIDSVLPGVTDQAALVEAHKRWFCKVANAGVTGAELAKRPR